MFHHFYGMKHPKGQGAISGAQLESIIKYIGRENILNAEQWKIKALKGILEPNELCFTFDDGLRCQYDIAKPILDKYEIRAFWFVYSTPLIGEPEKLELYRYFRTVNYVDISDFYNEFFINCSESIYGSLSADKLRSFKVEDYLSEFKFYTNEDRKFRFVRDKILGPERYFRIMDAMLQKSKFNINNLLDFLWMNSKNIKELHDDGHIIGLHSHSHPTEISTLPASEQKNEYRKNADILSSLLGGFELTMSHPCNSYNKATLEIAKEIYIKLGFRSNMALSNYSYLENPRRDHIDVLREMENKKH